ncbi:MAG: type IV pilus secretin PilQ [Legionellaceae bacterium]|nr:type IV pilus secretin PilQ [Legionellaceae bacterium]
MMLTTRSLFFCFLGVVSVVYATDNNIKAADPLEPLPLFKSLPAFQYPLAVRESPFRVHPHFMLHASPLVSENAMLDAQTVLENKISTKFTGKPLSLNVQKLPIREVLQLVADFAGINMVVADSVSGDMSLSLQNIPWDQVMEIILSTHGLYKRQEENVIFIALASEIAAQEKAQYNRQQIAEENDPLRFEWIQIKYAKASDLATILMDKNNRVLSKRGALTVDSRTNSLWVQDTPQQFNTIKALLQRLDIPVKQVLIEARVVDVTKDFAEDLGVRFAVSRPKALTGTLNEDNRVEQAPGADRFHLDLPAMPIGASPASLGVALATLGDGVLLDLELSALESEGKGNVIASPRLMTTNQQTAVIESGEEIPYQEATASGATAVSFKKAVLSLRVTPQITPDNKIMMELKINHDMPSAERFNGVPAILTKEIDTNVLVNNGQTIVLGGIYKQDKNSTIQRVPFLGTLPVVGALFRRIQDSVKNEELLIFITPKIIDSSFSINEEPVNLGEK